MSRYKVIRRPMVPHRWIVTPTDAGTDATAHAVADCRHCAWECHGSTAAYVQEAARYHRMQHQAGALPVTR